MEKIKEVVGSFAFEEGLKYLEKNPAENIPKLLNWAEKIATQDDHKAIINKFREYSKDLSSPWYQLFNKILTELHPNVRKRFLTNFFIRATLIGRAKARKLSAEYQCNIPWAILMDPTSACNLKCIGCWAEEYDQKDSLSYEDLDNIIEQGKNLGIYMYLYSGGEPLIRKKDLIKLAEKHHDCAFLAFTNGTLVDEDFAKDLVRVGNFVLAFSIEGLEEATDMRRGKGTYQKVINAMDLLREIGAGFGYSCCYHSKNIDSVASDQFVDFMIEKGCKFVWHFTYIPVGKNAAMDLVCTPEQRKYMYHRIREIRATKPIFALDFWNDGEYVDGCIAGGRNYFHINAHGDVEPCAFIHYSNVNIKECTLLEALKSPLFMQYRENQPFNKNMLRPCPLLDNPDKLRIMVHNAGAHSTQPKDMETVDELTDKLQHVSKAWGKVADILWEENHCQQCNSKEKDFSINSEG